MHSFCFGDLHDAGKEVEKRDEKIKVSHCYPPDTPWHGRACM